MLTREAVGFVDDYDRFRGHPNIFRTNTVNLRLHRGWQAPPNNHEVVYIHSEDHRRTWSQNSREGITAPSEKRLKGDVAKMPGVSQHGGVTAVSITQANGGPVLKEAGFGLIEHEFNPCGTTHGTVEEHQKFISYKIAMACSYVRVNRVLLIGP